MPINYQQIQSQIKSLGQQAREQEKRIQTRREKALQLLRQYAERLEDLKALLAREEAEHPHLFTNILHAIRPLLTEGIAVSPPAAQDLPA